MKINIGTNKGNLVGVEISKETFELIKFAEVKDIANAKYPGCSIIGWCPTDIKRYNEQNNKIKTMKNLTITDEKVLETVKAYPSTEEVFKSLFPEVFKNKEKFADIGSIFLGNKYPKNIYAIVKMERKIQLLNITQGTFFQNSIPEGNLIDPGKTSVAYFEFEKFLINTGRKAEEFVRIQVLENGNCVIRWKQ